MKDKCTVLVSSCDSYDDLWIPFFCIAKNQWPELPNYKIVLNTQSKSFSYEGLNIDTLQLYRLGSKDRWGERLIKTLEAIDSKYIIFLLDDFFLSGMVVQQELDKCVEYMEQDDNIAVFNFMPVQDENNIRSMKYKGFERRPQKGAWRLNCQAALWRKECLINYIRPHESAWDWEIYGSERSERYMEEFYVACPDFLKVFPYDADWGGAIHRGRWTPYAIDLCNKYKISVDFSRRGMETEHPPYEGKRNDQDLPFLKRIFRPPFLKRLREYLYMILWHIPKERIVRYKSLK